MREIADEALRVFAAAGEPSGLARALVHVGCLHWSRLDIVALEDALLRSLEHAREVGDTRQQIEAYNILLRATVVGPCRVAEGIARCERARADGGEVASLAALANAIQAVLEAMSGRIDVARDLYHGAHARLEEFGLGARLAGLQIYAAMAELIAGDPARIEAPLERACAELERIGERGRHSTALAVLARVRRRLGDEDEALRLTIRSEELAGVYDTSTHIIWSSTRGRILARRGELAEGERLAQMGVSIARRATAVYLTAEALRDLAEVLALAGRTTQARDTIDEAIALHTDKGNVAAAAAAREWRASL
jgi:tetratricopeptide (TPR) repeat protein